MDHVVPLVMGGEHCYDNVAVAQARCNLSKGGRPGQASTSPTPRKPG